MTQADVYDISTSLCWGARAVLGHTHRVSVFACPNSQLGFISLGSVGHCRADDCSWMTFRLVTPPEHPALMLCPDSANCRMPVQCFSSHSFFLHLITNAGSTPALKSTSIASSGTGNDLNVKRQFSPVPEHVRVTQGGSRDPDWIHCWHVRVKVFQRTIDRMRLWVLDGLPPRCEAFVSTLYS